MYLVDAGLCDSIGNVSEIAASTSASGVGEGLGVGLGLFLTGVPAATGVPEALGDGDNVGCDESCNARVSGDGIRLITPTIAAKMTPLANRTPPPTRTPGVNLLKKLAFGFGCPQEPQKTAAG